MGHQHMTCIVSSNAQATEVLHCSCPADARARRRSWRAFARPRRSDHRECEATETRSNSRKKTMYLVTSSSAVAGETRAEEAVQEAEAKEKRKRRPSVRISGAECRVMGRGPSWFGPCAIYAAVMDRGINL
jgi:hypothetical protein